MAKLFNITLPTDSTNLKLRGKQRVNVTYTVSNLTGRHVRGRVVLKPDDPAVKNKWITLSGETEKDFDANSTFQFPVTVNIPPNAPPGKYTFRLDAVNADIPDEGDSGSPCGFEIAAEEKKKMPVWIFPVAAVALLVVGGGLTWLLWPKKAAPPVKPDVAVQPTPTPIPTVTMPDEVGKNASDASTELTKLHIAFTVQVKPSSAQQANKVLEQSIAKNTQVDPGKTQVALSVGAPLIRVPLLVGLAYENARIVLAQVHFNNVSTDNRPVQNVSPGFVSAQDPAPGTEIAANDTVHMTVAAQLVPVPRVIGMSFGNAVLTLHNKGLDFGTVKGIQMDGIVQTQVPAENTNVALGTKVDLSLPGCTSISYLYRTPGCYTVVDRNIVGAYLSQNASYNVRLQQQVIASPALRNMMVK